MSSSELIFVNYGNEKKEISVPCDCGTMCSYMKCCAVKYPRVCQLLLGGFQRVPFMSNPPCPGSVLGSWLSNANSKERSKKSPVICTGEHKWLGPGAGDGRGLCQWATIFCHSLTHRHGLVLKCPGLSCIVFPCSAPFRATGHGGETRGVLEAV